LPLEKVEVLPNGVNTELFSPADAGEREKLRAALRMPPRAVVAAFVGRKQEVKGFYVFLQVVTRALAARKSLYVIAAGPEPEDSRREATYCLRREWRDKLRAGGAFAEYPAMSQAALTRFDWNIVTAHLEKIYLDVTARVHAA
jgi:glycosyltransferase involved in cell wall biosynthesis